MEEAEFFIKDGVLYKRRSDGKEYPASLDEAWNIAEMMLDEDCVFAYEILKWLTHGRLELLDDEYIEALLDCEELPKEEYNKIKMEAVRRGLMN